MRGIAFVFGLSIVLGAPLSAQAGARVPKPKVTPARSVGSPNQGHLEGGVEIKGQKGMRVVGANRWGLPDLVGMLERAAKRVSERHPGAMLTVGDLSKRGGGDIGGHHSHENGRDADLGFYLSDGKGRSFLAPRFATIDEEGRARGMAARFDDAKNWELVQALTTDPKARVLQVFVANHLRARLLAYAAAAGVPAGVRDRAASLMLQPHHALPHDNHFHVRIACPKNEKDCVDYATKSRPKNVAQARIKAGSRRVAVARKQPRR